LVVQASWNYERMVGLGVAFASEPLLRDLPGGVDGDRYREALGRAGRYFNAHPYLVGLAVGALARAEHENVPPDQMERLRTALTGPLGAVGDKLVWAGALPLASGIGVVLAVAVSPVVAVIAFLGLYNLLHVTLRVWGIAAGWRSGIEVARELHIPAVTWGLRLAGPLAALSAGLALPMAVAWLVSDLDVRGVLGAMIVAAVGIVLARWAWPTLGGLRFGLAAVALALIVGWM
jgi:PTS system mannose-specific IID component